MTEELFSYIYGLVLMSIVSAVLIYNIIDSIITEMYWESVMLFLFLIVSGGMAIYCGYLITTIV